MNLTMSPNGNIDHGDVDYCSDLDADNDESMGLVLDEHLYQVELFDDEED
jgi:hypothetical protein